MPEGVGYPEWVPGQNFVTTGGQLVDDDGDGVADREVGGARVPVAGPDPVLEDLARIRAGEQVPQLPPPGQSPPGGAPAPWGPPPAEPPVDLGGAARGLLGRATRGVADAGRGLADVGQGVRRATYGTELGIRAESDYSDDQAQQAIDASVAADRAEAAAEAEALTRKRARLEAHESRVQSLVNDRDKAVGDQLVKVQKLAEEARNTKINPQHLYQTADTGQKIAMYLAVAIGGFLAPKMGGKNPALDIINRAVENDIDAQKANLDNLREGVQAERTILGDLRQVYGDKAAAELALHGVTLDQIANDLDTKLAGVKDQRALARGLELSAKLHAEAAEKQRQAMERERAEADRRWEKGFKSAQLGEQIRSNKAGEYIAGRKLALDAEQAGLTASQAAAKAKAEADGETAWFRGVENGAGPDSKGIHVANPTQREALRTAVNGAEAVIDSVATIKGVMAKEGAHTEIDDYEKQLVESAVAEIKLEAAARVKGNPSDKDMVDVLNAAGGSSDPTAWFSSWAALDKEKRVKILNYVENRHRDTAHRMVQNFTGGKTKFTYKGHSFYETPPAVKAPTFSEARKAFLKGEAGPEILLGDGAAKSIAVNPNNRKLALGDLNKRLSELDLQLKTNTFLTPESRKALRDERVGIGKVALELKRLVEAAKVRPPEFKRSAIRHNN